MIDDKKIEEAARDYINKNGYFVKYDEDPCVAIELAYKEGAKWAVNELLKDLWHSNTEKPEVGQKILAYTIDGYETITYVGEGEIDCGTNWMDIVSDMAVACWCYPEVLCPKKGGEK